MKKILLGIVALLTGLSMQAQQSVTASGGEASGSGGTVSYSVGQLAYSTNSGTNGIISEGVQQPYEISEVTGIHDIEGINLIISAFPNPTTDFLQLKVDAFTSLGIGDMQYRLYDLQGKLLQSKAITADIMEISMTGLIPATYFVKVLHNNTIAKTFKVIKSE